MGKVLYLNLITVLCEQETLSSVSCILLIAPPVHHESCCSQCCHAKALNPNTFQINSPEMGKAYQTFWQSLLQLESATVTRGPLGLCSSFDCGVFLASLQLQYRLKALLHSGGLQKLTACFYYQYLVE